MKTTETSRLLLHACCGPCSTACLERLQARHDVTLFFANSNLFPSEEYERRLGEVRRLASACGCGLIEDTYDHYAWRRWVAGLEAVAEGGARCRRCFEFSLTRAACYAEAHGFDCLATTLTISPHKNSQDILAVGQAVTTRFLEVDFKSDDGFRRSLKLSRQYGMYRQDYCGCEFSLSERDRRRRVPGGA